MLVLRIDDVCRLSTDKPEQGSDGDLDYFMEWRKQSGLVGLPVVYGIVPAWLTDKGQKRLQELRGEETTAVHGWNHLRGVKVTLFQMKLGKKLLATETYVPPFNHYSDRTIFNWGSVGGKFFLGGFEGEHHSHGHSPKTVREVTHLPAERDLYGRSEQLVTDIKSQVPLVLTLHLPWETNPGSVAALVDKIRDQLVPLSQVEQWLLARSV